MSDPTSTDMKHRFKDDLIGWLNYISVNHEQTQHLIDSNHKEDSSICLVFEHTMIYYRNQIELAKEALHEVIFYALVHKEDYNTDFDVPKFEDCITYENYVDLIQYFRLHTYLKRELWKIDRKSALMLLQSLFYTRRHKLAMLYKVYLQLSLDVDDQDQFYSWVDVFADIFSKNIDILQLYNVVLIVYECLEVCMKTVRRKRAHSFKTLNRLIKFLHQCLYTYSLNRGETTEEERNNVYKVLFAIVQTVKESTSKYGHEDIESWYHLFQDEMDTEITTFNHYRNGQALSKQIELRSPPTLKKFLINRCKDNDTNNHEHVFVSILAYIHQGALISQEDEFITLSVEENNGMKRLEDAIREKYCNRPQIMGTFLSCVHILRRRCMFWKSVFKVIIQFLDLWIGVIEEAHCADIISLWISRENMLPVLYKHILKHVQHYNISNTSITIESINKLTCILEKSLDYVETNEQLLIFRDYVFHNRGDGEEVHMPILGSTEFWNISFDRDMTRVANQITSVEQDVHVPDNIIRKLIKLTTIWPYEVLHQLFLSSIHNKKQYKAIIPVLYNLGNLCMLKKGNECKNGEETPLLLLILKETLSPMNSNTIEEFKENIIHFMKACCTPVKFQLEPPLILLPNSMVDQTLLPLQSVLDQCILPNLSTSCDIIILEFSLHALNAFCESSLKDWTTLLNSLDLPKFLYCSPETYLNSLTEILALRFSHDEGPRLPLQVWESALKITYKFFDLIQFILKTNRFPRVHDFFTVAIKKYDWKTQLIWYNVTRDLSKHSLKVPSSFFRITGALDDLFVEDENISPPMVDINEGWYDILTACKLSTRLSDELFEHKEQWTYNLLLLWNHPNEDVLLLKCLEQVLHPKTSLSVSIEYHSLIVHFLSNLYLSFPEAHQVILDYNGYDNAQILPIIRNLSHTGTRQYFIVLYTTLLIKRQVRSSSEEDKQNNYFVSNLIKLLQGLTNWGNISQAAKSYNELKSIGAKLTPCTSIEPGNTLLRTESELDVDSEIKIFHYPLLSTAELISDRALSILSLFHMCSILREVKNRNQQQSVERFVMLIMEGLIDTPSQQIFQRMLQQQPKSRSKLWKQKKSNTKFIMKMRPIISEMEESLLRPVIERIPNSSQISQALGLTALHKGQQKKPYLYFLN